MSRTARMMSAIMYTIVKSNVLTELTHLNASAQNSWTPRSAKKVASECEPQATSIHTQNRQASNTMHALISDTARARSNADCRSVRMTPCPERRFLWQHSEG
jgi:hypothetical protein